MSIANAIFLTACVVFLIIYWIGYWFSLHRSGDFHAAQQGLEWNTVSTLGVLVSVDFLVLAVSAIWSVWELV